MRKVVAWVGIPSLVIVVGGGITGWTLLRDAGDAAETPDGLGSTAKVMRGMVVQSETYDGTIG